LHLGTIWSGRHWYSTPVSAAGRNHKGVFLFETIGDFDVGRDVLGGEQIDSVLSVTAILEIFFGLPLWWVGSVHSSMSGKTCPGDAVDRSSFIRALEAGMFSRAPRASGTSTKAAELLEAFARPSAKAQDAPHDAEPTHESWKTEESLGFGAVMVVLC
jgi:hypothetical protein